VSQLFNSFFSGKPELIVFDLDGTLVNSVPDLTTAVNRTLQQLGRMPVEEDAVRCWVGDGADMLMRRALARDETEAAVNKVSETLLANAMTCFFHNYRMCNGEHSTLYPTVHETLEQLNKMGIPLAVVTNKPKLFSDILLDQLGIAHCFQMVVGGECLANKKPHPEPLLYASMACKTNPLNSLMVGDSRNDVQAAKAACFKVACVDYGYNHGKPIEQSEPDRVIKSLSVLLV